MLLDNNLPEKYPVPIVLDSLTISLKLYTLDETHLKFKKFRSLT